VGFPDPAVLVARARLDLPPDLDGEQLALAEHGINLGIIAAGQALQVLLNELAEEDED
jgi:hypothetical protein